MVRPCNAFQASVDPIVMNSSNEINRLELLKTLWRRKFIIILIAALGFWGAYGLSLFKKEEWRSNANVIAPQLTNIVEFIETNRQVQRIIDPSEDVNVSELMDDLFNTFLYTAADSEEKNSYLSQTDVFIRLNKEQDANAGLILDELSRRLSVQIPDDKTETLASGYLLSFVSDTAESAQNILSGYIANINRVAVEISQKEFINKLKAQIAIRKQKMIDIELDLHNSRKADIENYSEALLIAQKAGIKSTSTKLHDRTNSSNNVVLEINANSGQLYYQGEENLTALLDVAKNTPITYPESYYRLQYEIEALEPLLDKRPVFESFHYIVSPTLAPTREAPKRTLIALIGGMASGILASLYVLVAATFTNRRRLESTES